MVRRRLLDDAHQSGNDVSPNILITVLVLAIAVILSASLYLLLRFFRRNNNNNTHNHSHSHSRHRPHSLSSTNRHVISRRVTPENKAHNSLMEALPLFTSESLKTTGDCAVCLSKFEQKDLLRLLPICCHVFHADCIDTWLNSNQSCPLCRSPVFLPDSELLPKLVPQQQDTSSVSSESFRVEIGNVSRRNESSGEFPVRRSYSLGGNFDYIVDDDVVSEVHSGSFRRTSSTTEFKTDTENNNNLQQQSVLAAEVGTRGGGGGWLKDYLTHSLSSSFRSSGRWFFTGSSRRETTTTTSTNEFGESEMDLEASRLGDEIGELFRWLSGV